MSATRSRLNYNASISNVIKSKFYINILRNFNFKEDAIIKNEQNSNKGILLSNRKFNTNGLVANKLFINGINFGYDKYLLPVFELKMALPNTKLTEFFISNIIPFVSQLYTEYKEIMSSVFNVTSIKSLENRIYNDLLLLSLNSTGILLSEVGLNNVTRLIALDVNRCNAVIAINTLKYKNLEFTNLIKGMADFETDKLGNNIDIDSNYFRRNVINYIDE